MVTGGHEHRTPLFRLLTGFHYQHYSNTCFSPFIPLTEGLGHSHNSSLTYTTADISPFYATITHPLSSSVICRMCKHTQHEENTATQAPEADIQYALFVPSLLLYNIGMTFAGCRLSPGAFFWNYSWF